MSDLPVSIFGGIGAPTVVTQRTVRGDVDTLFLCIRDEVILGKQGVRLDLVDSLVLELSADGPLEVLGLNLTGTTPVASISASICSMVKLETPTARTWTLPSTLLNASSGRFLPWILEG